MWNRNSGKKYRILSIDGGGMKGVFTAYSLWRLEEEFNIKIRDHFDMIVGTSTGALIAAGILVGQSGKQIYDSYIDQNNPIFKDKIKLKDRISMTFLPQYTEEGILKFLEEQIGDHTLETLYKVSGKKDFAFFASNFTKAQPLIYGSPSLNHSDITLNEVPAMKALRTTTSAPFFFEPVHDENDELLIDGGLWANNPSLAGVNLAVGNLGIDNNDIEVLSYGQSFTADFNFKVHSKSEVLMSPMKQQFVQLLLSTLALNQNSQSALVKNLLKERLFRYEPELHQANVAIDSIDIKFLNYAKVYWQKNKEDLVKFILTGENTKKYNN